MKKILGIIIIIILIGSIVFLTIGSSIIPGAGYRVDVQGTAYRNILGHWGVTYDGYSITEDNWNPFTFLNDKVDVEVYLFGAGEYSGSARIPGHNPILYEESFSVPVRWVKSGTYNGRIDIYHVDMDDIFGFIEISRTKVGTTTFSGLIV